MNRFRDALPALIPLVGFALVYALTACPTFAGGDSAELAAAAAGFGVPHPPGYPTYTVVTGLVGRATALTAEDFAGATALASGLYAAAALALGLLLLRRLEVSVVAALAGVAALGSGRTLWSQAVVTEVYTFDLLLGAAAALALIRATRAGAGFGAAVVAGALAGLWLGHRFVNLIYLPAALALLPVGGVRAALQRTWKPLLLGAAGSGLVYAYLPLASARDPVIDIGDPSSFERFLVVVRGAPYLRHMTGGGWQLERFLRGLPRELGPLALLAPVGIAVAWRRRRRLALALLWVVTAGLAFASRYRILDIEVYFLPALAALAVGVALGADVLLAAARRRGGAVAGALAAGVLLASTAGLFTNRAACDRSWNRLARRSAEDLLASVDEGGAVLVQGDTTIHGLWYLQGVERARPDVLVISVGHLWPWHLEQLRARFPQAAWPVFEGSGALPPSYLRALLDALEPGHPMYAALSLDTSGLIAADAAGRSYGTLPRGVAWRILPRGESVSAAEWAAWNADFLTAAVERLGPVPPEVDMDTKSTLLQYALALSQNAALLERLGQHAAARESWRQVLSLDPDRHERDVAEDAWRGLGVRVPRMEAGRRAREALERLPGG